MLNLYRLNYYTTAIFLLAGTVMVFGENDEFSLPTGHQHKTADTKLTPDLKNNDRPYLSDMPNENPNPNPNPHRQPPTGPNQKYGGKNDTQQYQMYMQVAETILAMLRLSPLLAQEVQRCLNESKTFHEIMSHLPRALPSDDSVLAALGIAKSLKKVHQRIHSMSEKFPNCRHKNGTSGAICWEQEKVCRGKPNESTAKVSCL